MLECKLNSTCTSNDDCFLIGHAECNRNLCMCAPGFETDGRTCTMDNSSFCFDGSDCRNNLTHWCNETTGLCSCRVGYEGLGDDCVAPLNKPCTPEEGCIDPDAECVDFRCNCRSGLVAEGGRCVSHHGTHIHLKARGNGEISVELDIEED
ncbi:hypothetical protein J437_LFUL000590 [Ladona fulva]|uniref:EGF-like domain-containing protein n=1 Tax=Ladona fulva TaxID=123851 RepID=A0A8K0K888_LADFU|nr:hypothetical protein J437_LFUL000590 [Ladona fulva]